MLEGVSMYIMSERMRIHGGIPLKGEVAVSGGKNASLAIIPATLLASSPCTLENVPDIEDVRVTIEMLRCLGAEVEFENNVLLVDPTTVKHAASPTSTPAACAFLLPGAGASGPFQVRRGSARRLSHRRPAHRPDHQRA